MVIAGIVAEYNPFHNGHKYQLAHIKQALSADVCVVVMSTSFVQRGEPAIFDKWRRAESAVKHGADLVVELPVYYTTQSARQFAQGAVEILRSLNCTHLCFGSEAGDLNVLSQAAKQCNETPEFSKLLKQKLKCGYSYAAAVACVSDVDTDVIRKPNNILAIEYINAIKNLNINMVCYTHKRKGAQHDCMIPNHGYASASAVRKLLKDGNSAHEFMPYISVPPIAYEKYEQLAVYRLLTADPTDLPAGGGGLWQRLKRNVSKDLTETISRTKSRHFSICRIKRLIVSHVINNNLPEGLSPTYIRPLAMNSLGCSLLKAATLPVISKGANYNRTDPLWLLECRATDVYNLLCDNPIRQDLLECPSII